MIETSGNLWHFHTQGRWVVTTTNGSVRKDGCAVMGRGVAREAAAKFPTLPKQLGHALRLTGNRVFEWPEHRLFTLPVKHQWQEEADIGLIREGAKELARMAERMYLLRVYLVRPGCGNGGLRWEKVRPILEPILDDRFVVVEKPHGDRV